MAAPERVFENYKHHGASVWVRADLRGQHREYCLCYHCECFHPEDRERNCRIANALFAMDQLCEITTPVWECQCFVLSLGKENPDG